MKARSIISCIVLLVAVACQNSGVEQADQFLANTEIGIVETQDPIIKGLLDSYPSAESLSAKNVFGNADVKSLTQSDVSKLSFTKLSFYELDADAMLRAGAMFVIFLACYFPYLSLSNVTVIILPAVVMFIAAGIGIIAESRIRRRK